MKFNTGGHGGKEIRESVRIQTNDPNRPWLGVAVTGKVEKFAEIRPERFNLSGSAGQELIAEVEIIPRKDYPFKILNVKVRSGEFIKYEMTEKMADGQKHYVIRVENLKAQKGRYIDTLFVRTDSGLKPTIPIHVIGVIR